MNFNSKRPRSARVSRLVLTAFGAVLVSSISAPAFAFHADSAGTAPLRGLITAVGSSQLQLQTANGTVSVGLVKGMTHVVRSVMGSTADVAAGKRVDVHLVRGTRTVDAIRIEQQSTSPLHRVKAHVPPRAGVRPDPHREGNGGNRPQPLSGQVVSLNGGTLTLRYGNGSTGTYTLGPNVIVNEALLGTLADLGVGETVQVALGKSGNVAHTITIINA